MCACVCVRVYVYMIAHYHDDSAYRLCRLEPLAMALKKYQNRTPRALLQMPFISASRRKREEKKKTHTQRRTTRSTFNFGKNTIQFFSNSSEKQISSAAADIPMSMPVSTCSGELPDFKSLFLMCFERTRTSTFFPAHVV